MVTVSHRDVILWGMPKRSSKGRIINALAFKIIVADATGEAALAEDTKNPPLSPLGN